MFDLTTVKEKAYLSLQSASNMSPLPNHYDGELLPIFPSLHLRLLPSCSRMDTSPSPIHPNIDILQDQFT
jgi:hypothetical protein